MRRNVVSEGVVMDSAWVRLRNFRFRKFLCTKER
jgi:hypothetical protein